MVNAELLVTGWLRGLLDPIRVVTNTPADLEQILPVVQVERVGGPTLRFSDGPLLYIYTYDTSRLLAVELAIRVQDLMLHHLPGVTAAGGRVQTVGCPIGPQWLPYDNPNVNRTQATYATAIRPVATG
ncbi:phage tail termination protein [Embleya sp. NPDC001921]